MRVLAWVAVVVPSLALGTSWVPHSLGDRVRLADRVVLAQVLRIETVAEGHDARRLKTVTTVTIAADYKGHGPQTVQVVQLGGRSGAVDARIPGDASFSLGERTVLFLRCATPERCALVGLGIGKVELSGDEAFVKEVGAEVTLSRWPLATLEKTLRGHAKALPAPVVPGRAGQGTP